jgi:hypothetical protein
MSCLDLESGGFSNCLSPRGKGGSWDVAATSIDATARRLAVADYGGAMTEARVGSPIERLCARTTAEMIAQQAGVATPTV